MRTATTIYVLDTQELKWIPSTGHRNWVVEEFRLGPVKYGILLYLRTALFLNGGVLHRTNPVWRKLREGHSYRRRAVLEVCAQCGSWFTDAKGERWWIDPRFYALLKWNLERLSGPKGMEVPHLGALTTYDSVPTEALPERVREGRSKRRHVSPFSTLSEGNRPTLP